MTRTVDEPIGLDLLHALLGDYARQLWDVQEVRIMTGNRISAMERDGRPEQWMAPLRAQQAALKSVESSINGRLVRLMRQHPMRAWVDQTRGIAAGGFGRLMGATGPLWPPLYDDDGNPTSGFANPAKLWKYVGLSVDDGRSPRRTRGERLHFSPRGRVVCYQIADAIVKVGGPYRALYDEKRAAYLARPRLGPSGCAMGYEHRTKKGVLLPCVYPKEEGDGEASGHIDAAAKRFAVKRLLLDMWRAWRDLPVEGE